MHALRMVHEALIVGGTLLDMRPGFGDPPVLSRCRKIGVLDGSALTRDVQQVERVLAESTNTSLFAVEREAFFDLSHHFASASDLFAEVANWRRIRVPPEVRTEIASAAPPFEVRESCVMRRLRAL